MSEQPRTDADHLWQLSEYAVPPPSGASEDAAWKPGYRFLVRFTRRDDGAPVADCLILFGPDINAAALRALSLRSNLALAGEAPEGAWRDDRPLDRAFSAIEAAERETWPRPEEPRPATPRAPLTRPDGTDPQGFAHRVAKAYREALAAKDSAPAKTLAAEAGVPVTTVHRWIREARRLGALGPASAKGRAG